MHLLSEPCDKCETAAKSEEILNGEKETAIDLVTIKEQIAPVHLYIYLDYLYATISNSLRIVIFSYTYYLMKYLQASGPTTPSLAAILHCLKILTSSGKKLPVTVCSTPRLLNSAISPSSQSTAYTNSGAIPGRCN
jgi:hypothetical protein